MTTLPLTKRQQAVLDVIVEHRRQKGYSPSISEIAQEMDFKSPNAAQEHVNALVSKGALTRKTGVPRSLIPTENAA